MKRWAAVLGALLMGVGAAGTALASEAPASTARHAPAAMRCDGDRDADDVGCPVRTVVVHRCDGDRDRDDIGCVALAPRVVVVQPRLTG